MRCGRLLTNHLQTKKALRAFPASILRKSRGLNVYLTVSVATCAWYNDIYIVIKTCATGRSPSFWERKCATPTFLLFASLKTTWPCLAFNTSQNQSSRYRTLSAKLNPNILHLVNLLGCWFVTCRISPRRELRDFSVAQLLNFVRVAELNDYLSYLCLRAHPYCYGARTYNESSLWLACASLSCRSTRGPKSKVAAKR